MLANAKSLFKLASDVTYERKFAGPLQLQQVEFELLGIFEIQFQHLRILFGDRLMVF